MSDTPRQRAARLRVRHVLGSLCVLIATICPGTLATAGRQGAASIAGRVELAASAPAHEPRPDVAGLALAPRPAHTDRRRSVVYLDPAPRAAFDVIDEPRHRMDQRNESFVPHVLAIVAGTTVEFPNNDRTYHNVFSLSKPRTFDLGRYAAGRSKAVRFDTPGIVRVFCDIHSHMSAYIVVFAHRYFAVTDEAGRYRIDNVPAGTYTIVAWNEVAETASRRVTVTGAGDSAVDFLLRRR